MSTCPMAALGPPRDPPDTTHGVGVTNRPPTNVNFPNGRIRPSKRSPRYRHMEWERQIGHQPMSTCPTAALGPPRNPPDTDTWSGSDKSATNQCQLAQRPH